MEKKVPIKKKLTETQLDLIIVKHKNMLEWAFCLIIHNQNFHSMHLSTIILYYQKKKYGTLFVYSSKLCEGSKLWYSSLESPWVVRAPKVDRQ